MELYLIRHAQSHANVIEHYNSHKTYLTEKGLKQALKLAKYLKDEKIDKIFSSDAIRSKQTAKELSLHLSCPVGYLSLLRPLNKGVLIGKPKKIFYEYVSENNKDPLLFRPEKGENFQDVYRRANRFMDLLKKDSSKRVIVLSHSTFLQTLKLALSKRPLNKTVLQDIPNCSVVRKKLIWNKNPN